MCPDPDFPALINESGSEDSHRGPYQQMKTTFRDTPPTRGVFQQVGTRQRPKTRCIREKKSKQWWFLGEPEGRWATHNQGGEWGTDVWNGVRTGVSERLPSSHPVTTSVRCVWTQSHAGVVAICSDQPVCDRCVVVDFVARWKEGVWG